MESPLLHLKGKMFNLEIRFLWDEGKFITAELFNKNHILLEKWEWELPAHIMRQYSVFIPAAKTMLFNFIKSKE